MKILSLRQRFMDDIKRVEFIPLKILNFFSYAALLVPFPFLTIHARSIGLSEKEYGTIAGTMPVISLIVPPIIGMLADRIGNFKYLLSILLMLNGLSGAAFVMIPKAQPNYLLDDQISLNATCFFGSPFATISQDPSCYLNEKEFQVHVHSCDFQCSTESLNVNNSLLQSVSDWCTATKNCKPVLSHKLILTLNKTANISVMSNQLEETMEIDGTFGENFCPSYSEITLNKYDYMPVDTMCWISCTGSSNRNNVCKQGYSIRSVIIIYFIARLILGLFVASSIPMVESAIVTVIKEKNGDLGFQKVFSNLGVICLTPISGILIDYFSSEGEVNFSPVFYMYFLLNFICAIILYFVDLQFKSPSKTVIRDVLTYLRKPEIIILIVVSCVMGIIMGVMDTFLFWLLEDLGAQNYLMSLTVTIGTMFGIPVLLFSTQIFAKIGTVNSMLLGMATYTIRLLGYSIIQNPWLAMPFEALECITTSLFLVAVITYVGIMATPTTMASIQSIVLAMLFGVGRGTGALVGGYMITDLGIRTSFQVAAGMCAITFIFYFSTIKFCINNKVNDTMLTKNGYQSKIKMSTDAKNDVESQKKLSS